MELQVLEHSLDDGESLSLDAAPRVVYRLAEKAADYTTGPVTLNGPAHLLSFELVPAASAEAKLSAPVEFDGERLIRLDTVSFPPGGVAYLHVHRGPGIRVLLEGEIRIETEGTTATYGPLEAWFESGPGAGVRGRLGDSAHCVRALHGAAGRAAREALPALRARRGR